MVGNLWWRGVGLMGAVAVFRCCAAPFAGKDWVRVVGVVR